VPYGEGDFETLWNVRLMDPSVCKNPTAADARRVEDGLHWSVIGRGEISAAGFVCKNAVPFPLHNIAALDPYQCDNYEVRFCCPRGKTYRDGNDDQIAMLLLRDRCRYLVKDDSLQTTNKGCNFRQSTVMKYNLLCIM